MFWRRSDEDCYSGSSSGKWQDVALGGAVTIHPGIASLPALFTGREEGRKIIPVKFTFDQQK